MKVPGKVAGACLLGMLMLAATAVAQNQDQSAGQDSLRFPNCPDAMIYLAQGPMNDTHPGPPWPPMDRESFENQRKHIEQLRLLKMLELLNLSKEQEIPFLTAFNETRQKGDDIEAQTREYVDQLSAGLEDGSLGDTDIYKLVEKISDGVRSRMKLVDEFLAQAKGMLTAEQYGKLVIFHMRFEAQMLEQLKSFRDNRRQGHGQGQGQGERVPRGGGK